MRRIVLSIILLFLSIPAFGMKVFDMKEIRDPRTLQIKVLQDWHPVNGVIETRQKLVTINVGDLWPGQEYRNPGPHGSDLPANRKAKGVSPHWWKFPIPSGKGCQAQPQRA